MTSMDHFELVSNNSLSTCDEVESLPESSSWTVPMGSKSNHSSNYIDGPLYLSMLYDNDDDSLQEFTITSHNFELSLPRTQIVTEDASDGMSYIHEIVIPSNFDNHSTADLYRKTTKLPAKTYDFELHLFQKEAIACIDNNHTVFVAAHPFAGKTVVAEYCVAFSLRESKRVIYTTPIEELITRTYHDFFKEFEDVSLVTDLRTCNPEKNCYIMNMENLYNMLQYPDSLKDVGWVIFDDIHYIMTDKERYYILEIILISLNNNVRMVFLSATIQNTKQFMQWVANSHDQICHVINTEYRPIQINHYIYPAYAIAKKLKVDEHTIKNKSHNTTFTLAMNDIIKNTFHENKFEMVRNIASVIKKHDFDPIIIFSFNQNDCELLSLEMALLDFTTDNDKQSIIEFFDDITNKLSEDDHNLPAIFMNMSLIQRGIGFYHKDTLPILKKTIEILFSKGLLKVIITTEIYAMGFKTPAKTVLITSCFKLDKNEQRLITPGEYIQMSSRAGGRGLYDNGEVILIIDGKVSSEEISNIIQGNPDPICSEYYFTYNIMFNQMLNNINPEYMLQNRFLHFQNQVAIKELTNKVDELSIRKSMILVKKDQDIRLCYALRKQLDTLKQFFYELETSKFNCMKYFDDTDPYENELHCIDPVLMQKAQEIKYFKEIINEHNENAIDDINIYYSLLLEQVEIDYKILNAKLKLEKTLSLLHKNDVDCRTRILNYMNYIANEEFEVKGEVACQLCRYSNQTYSTDELMMTELFYNKVFDKLEIPQLVAMLSLFVHHNERNKMSVKNYERAIRLGKMLLNETEFRVIARQIAKECNNEQLQVNEDANEERFPLFFMYICHEWCRGTSFRQLCQMTCMTEESIVVVMTMLTKIIKRLLQVSRYFGNTELAKKLQKAIGLIERDFVLEVCKTPLLELCNDCFIRHSTDQ